MAGLTHIVWGGCAAVCSHVMQTHSSLSIQLSSRDAHVLRSLLASTGFASHTDEAPRQVLSQLIAGATMYQETPRRSSIVALYDRVTVAPLDDADQALLTFELVTPVESPAIHERVSVLAPLGLGVLGRQVGDTITVELPSGLQRYRIAALHKSGT